MSDFLGLKKSNCKNCYKCIRHCPVKSIKFADDQANIVSNECILCGECFVNCPQNAKVIRDDLPQVKELIASGRPVIASVAPSFISEFGATNFSQVKRVLQKLGFASAEETAIGAGIVKNRYQEMIADGQHPLIISSCCHTINTLIQKYYPGALPYLADVLSPMLAHCQLIKEQNPGAATVFIGPCISKKEEASIYGICDVVLTFEDLESWMTEEHLVIEPDPADESGKRPRFFPIPGGIIASMDTADTGYSYIAIDGVENCKAALKEIEAGGLSGCFVEMNACEGGCINGPATTTRHQRSIAGAVKVRSFAGKEEFDAELKAPLEKKMDYIGVRAQIPGEAAIKEILSKMGKTSPEKELNCGSCGYNTCREKAIAVYQGKADLSMCLPFLKEKAESFSDKIISNTPNAIFVLDEDLNIQQINQAALSLFNIPAGADLKGTPLVRILNPTDYLNTMVTGRNVLDKKYYLAEYKKYVAETIIYDKEYHMIFSIMRDITDAETKASQEDDLRRETAEITDQVIEKQMRVVQEIASLLGETTAETKIALTKLKSTIQK
ncbi:PAS domain-containing protein [Anaerofilum sp. BX8]|uniref:PAS domain-containing protein n=1 Tax=Anaerofilum hominis TaxID=2763016 RepID=A0A923I8D8_9FIRM|nr:[Fe-Fe] hydrogenase large subunit C-terminal domain-containing protein [Anaerofilum hominis]MBC5580138.1 PAS domain-containing protein [Anaerofilum hominis]